MSIYARSAAYYDALLRAQGKNYAAESARVRDTIEARKRSDGTALLDVGCGTGIHLSYLRQWYDCEGLDIDRAMLAIAGERLSGIPLYCHDMIGFNLGQRFDAIVCLFSSIGYVPNVRLLEQTLETFAKHLKRGGVAIVEPWLRPEEWRDGYVDAAFADEPGLKVARMSVNRRDGNVSIVNFNYMIAASDGVRTFAEPHRLVLFTDSEYRRAFERAGFEIESDPVGLTGRGLFIGIHR
ncbi:MAG: class I SAM-dependent methyltransferase [Candidatus Eremiobacteraeota bacterium]|nr:class I SAM-dependent methyltransferase [Candidatus Eremiobacteraeota bacterium]